MAEIKTVDLGTVTEIHPSGVCETDKGHRVFGAFKRGDKLVQDLKSKKVTLKEKKQSASKEKSNDDSSSNVGDDNV